jgi:hypothetical protein
MPTASVAGKVEAMSSTCLLVTVAVSLAGDHG